MTAPIQQTEELKEELVLEYKSRLEEFPEEERADRTMDVVKGMVEEQLLLADKIELAPLESIRGRSFDNCIYINLARL